MSITETIVRGPLVVKLSDGRKLFRIYRKREYDGGTVISRVEGIEFHTRRGWVDLDFPGQEWCKDPDGTERRCSHFAEMMRYDQPEPPKQSFIRRAMQRVFG